MPKSRRERNRKTKIGTEVAHVTRDSDTTFKVKGHQAALLTAVLAHQAAAAMGVRTCWPWETAGHMNIRGPQLFYSFYHTLDESSSYWHTIYGLELCFIVFVFNNQCFDFMYCA